MTNKKNYSKPLEQEKQELIEVVREEIKEYVIEEAEDLSDYLEKIEDQLVAESEPEVSINHKGAFYACQG